MIHATVGREGEIALPDEVRERHGLVPDTPLRIIETRTGILIVPLTEEPPSEDLAQELALWQSAGLETWNLFPYEDETPGASCLSPRGTWRAVRWRRSRLSSMRSRGRTKV